MTLEPGALIAGRYQLELLLGQGGMGVVWSAIHTLTRRRVALKILKGPAHLRADLRRRFLREARAVGAIAHPNLVAVHDVIELDDGTPVMVMDLLEGETLGQKLARDGAMDLPQTATILLPVVSAVGAAHAVGVVHRDLKPDNVFLGKARTGDRDVRVLDFGIAKLMNAEGPAAETGLITGTGMMLGTPCYMSPEQAFGEKKIDRRTDVWAIGVLLYECLSGSRPVEGESIGQVVKRLATDAITPLEVLQPDLPTEVTALVGRMLSREREGRPADLREVLRVLRGYSQVSVPDFKEAGEEAAEALVEDTQDPVPLGQSDPGRAVPTLNSTPRWAETGGPHTITAPGGRRVRRWGWLAAALALPAVGYGTLFRAAPEVPLGAPVASPTPAAAPPVPAAPVEPVVAPRAPSTVPSATASALAAPVAPPAARPKAASQSALTNRMAAPAASAVPPPAPREAPNRGGLAEKPPF